MSRCRFGEITSGKRTPEGILTRIAKTSVGRILKEIETRADPQTLDLGFMLLTLGENALLKVSKAIDLITARARRDTQSHDVSVPLDEAGAGLTIHCNDEPLGVRLNYNWKPDAEMDRLTSGLRKPTPFEDLFTGRRRKLGRNDPCPCNSGLKYKKCHGK